MASSVYILALGLATLCPALTVLANSNSSTTASPTNSTNTTDNVNIAPVPYNFIDTQVKPAVTLACLAVFTLIGFLIAKMVDRWWDRKEPPDNASDCSERTRDLLRARFALYAFENIAEGDSGLEEVITGKEPHEKEEGETEQEGAEGTKKVGKLWMLKTAFMGSKRKRVDPGGDPEEGKANDQKALEDTSPEPAKDDQKGRKVPHTKKDKKDAKGKKDEFIDVQFTHHRVEESFTISKRMDPKDLPEGENPFMFKYRHVSEDVLIPVRMTSPEAANENAGSNVASPTGGASNKKELPKELGYYAELTLAPTRLGHYADSDFGSDSSLQGSNKSNNNHECKGQNEDDLDQPKTKKAKSKSPSPTKRAHFSTTSTESPTKQTVYEDDFESVSTGYDNRNPKRIQTGKTDKTDYSFVSGPTIGTSQPSVGTVFSTETPRNVEVKEKEQEKPKQEKGKKTNYDPVGTTTAPDQFAKVSTKDRGKAKRITVQPRI